jgi:hypothetical protein
LAKADIEQPCRCVERFFDPRTIALRLFTAASRAFFGRVRRSSQKKASFQLLINLPCQQSTNLTTEYARRDGSTDIP